MDTTTEGWERETPKVKSKTHGLAVDLLHPSQGDRAEWYWTLEDEDDQFDGIFRVYTTRNGSKILQADLRHVFAAEIEATRKEAYQQASESAGIHFLKEIDKAISAERERIRKKIGLLAEYNDLAGTLIEKEKVLAFLSRSKKKK